MSEDPVETNAPQAIVAEAPPNKELVTVYQGRTEDGGILSVPVPTGKADVIEERRRFREKGLLPAASERSVKLEFKEIPPTNTLLTLNIPGQAQFLYERFIPSNLNPAERQLHRYPDVVFMRRLTQDDLDRLQQENPNLPREPLAKYLTDPVLAQLPPR
jgi:hypothetical protein